MSLPTPAAKSAAKAVVAPHHAVLASHPVLQLMAGVIAGAVAWTTITLPSFPRFYTGQELSAKQAAEGAAAGEDPRGGPGRGDDRVRGEGRGGEGGGGEGRNPTAAAQNPTANEPPAQETSPSAPVEATLAEATADGLAAALRGASIPEQSDSTASGCQPPQDTAESAAPDAAAGSAPAAAESPPPTREDVPVANESSVETSTAETSTAESPPGADEGAGIDEEAIVDDDGAAAPAMDSEEAREEREVQQMREDMRRMGGMPAMGGMGGMAPAPPPLTPEQLEEARTMGIKNAAVAIGFFGMLLCGLIGLVEGISRRSLVAPLVGLLVGSFLGAVGGGLAGMAGKAIYNVDFSDLARDYLDRHPQVAEVRPILDGMLLYGTMWAILGIAAGLAMSLLSRRPRVVGRSMFGAALGGLLAGVIYATIEAVAFPLEAEGLVIPRGQQPGMLWIWALPLGLNGWLWATIPAGTIALLGCWQGRVPSKIKSKSAFKVRKPAPAA